MSSGSDVCKLILLGNGSVGKSSIVRRFVEDGFNRCAYGLKAYCEQLQR